MDLTDQETFQLSMMRGFGSYIRAYWKAQILPTDEAMIRWTDAGIQDLNFMTWSSENQFVRVLYYRIMYTISLCNDFLAVSTDESLLANGVSEEIQQRNQDISCRGKIFEGFSLLAWVGFL